MSVHFLRELPIDDVADFATYAVNIHETNHCFEVLKRLEVDVEVMMAKVLPKVDADARSDLLQNIVRPSDLFCRISKAIRTDSGQFVSENPANPADSLRLLPIILEEEGPAVGFDAGIFCLSKFFGTADELSRILSFLSPLFTSPVRLGNMISLDAVQIDAPVYGQLMQRLGEVITNCLLDLLKEFKLVQLVDLAARTKTPLSGFLVKNAGVDRMFEVEQIRQRVTDVPEILREELRAAKWETWIRALA
jgi:hypothetical protein